MTSGFHKLLAGVLLVLCSGMLQAATVQGLYIAELIVPEQQSQPAQSQLQQGLQQVLIKVSGSGEVTNKPAVAAALQQPAALMQQFSYQSTQIPVATGDGREVLGQRLIMEFDPILVDGLLSDAGAAAIGHARPEVLVWLVAQQSSGQRDFLAPDGRIYSELNGLALQRGLPVVAPLYDLADQQALALSDIWGFFEAPIRTASNRYQPDAVLVGRLIQSERGGWQTEWQLYSDSQVRTLQPGGSLSQQLQGVMDETADQVLATLSSSGFRYQETGLQLEVVNINSIADFLQLTAYVRQLPPVESALVSQVNNDRVIFRVEMQGGIETLEQAVRLNPRMSLMPRLSGDRALGNGTADDGASGISYRWQE
ncbi:MAG: DUF2066 domain-containing protein [Amphritea sp.]|nr:DUF2066 domain-containing protein [Amphritea sp.]